MKIKKLTVLVAAVCILAIGGSAIALAAIINSANKTTGNLTVGDTYNLSLGDASAWTAVTEGASASAVKNGDEFTTTLTLDSKNQETEVVIVAITSASDGKTVLDSAHYEVSYSLDDTPSNYTNYATAVEATGKTKLTIKVKFKDLEESDNGSVIGFTVTLQEKTTTSD